MNGLVQSSQHSGLTITDVNPSTACPPWLLITALAPTERPRVVFVHQGKKTVLMELVESESFDDKLAVGTSRLANNTSPVHHYIEQELMINVALEFGDSEECFRFIQHGIKKVHMGRFDNDDAVINDVYEKVTPLAIDHRRAELAALRRGLSKYDFDDERVQPPTQVACHRASPSDNHARPCVLMLHLEVWTGDPNRGCLVLSAHWSATDFLPSYPSCSNPFQYLTSFHSSDPASAAQSHDLSSSRHSGALNITISAHGISVLDGTSTVSARNGLTINGVNRAIIINHISAIMGDYFGIVNGGNAGGTNNTNYAHSYAR
ncbi:hypothetical protein EYR38_010847 [Pleurotus pulmonarius]|nr:hypothetical protein EYR38_010847 [Pleurotus pulmonarius]